jgi:hypothetical protein
MLIRIEFGVYGGNPRETLKELTASINSEGVEKSGEKDVFASSLTGEIEIEKVNPNPRMACRNFCMRTL